MKNCQYCGVDFEPSKYVPNTQKYCGSSCRDRARYYGDYRKIKINRATTWIRNNRKRYRATARKSYLKNRASRIARSIKHHKANPEAGRRSCRNYRKRWPERVNAKQAARHARKLRAIPKWADLEKIGAIYEACPPGFHVDHIIPLKGKTVCGLHCEDNLQILPAAENLKKSNRLT